MALEPIEPQQYQALLDAKSEQIRRRFDELGSFASGLVLDVFSSKPENYRMRAEFRMWHEGMTYFMLCFHQVINISPFA